MWANAAENPGTIGTGGRSVLNSQPEPTTEETGDNFVRANNSRLNWG